MLAILDRHRFAPSAIVMSFEGDTWRRVRQLRPDVRAGALYSPRMLPVASIEAELGALRQAGFVHTERNGKNIFYSVNYEQLQHVHGIVEQLIER